MGGGFDGFKRKIFVILVVGEIVVRFLKLALPGGAAGLAAAGAHGAGVLFHRDGERRGRGKQALLQQLQNKLGGELLPFGCRRQHAELGVFQQRLMAAALGRGVADFEVLHATLGKPASAIRTLFQFRFHPSDHDRFKLGAVGTDGAGETLVVEQFEQRGKTFDIAVMRRGRQK